LKTTGSARGTGRRLSVRVAVLDEINRREHSPVRAGSNPKETQLCKQECVFELAGLEPPTS
jgi:hypothetical protein